MSPSPLPCKIETMSETETNPQAAAEEPATPETAEELRLPPPTFTFIVFSLRTQAEMQLGLMHFGEEEKPQPELQLARHTIDLLGILLEKTKGNLSLEEQRFLENSLTELRFRYVQVSDEVAKAAEQKA